MALRTRYDADNGEWQVLTATGRVAYITLVEDDANEVAECLDSGRALPADGGGMLDVNVVLDDCPEARCEGCGKLASEFKHYEYVPFCESCGNTDQD